MSIEKAWYYTVMLLLVISSTALWLIAERKSIRLQQQNEQLILQNDSLHMLQLKTRKELIYSNNKIDSLHINLTYKNRRR